MKLTDEMQGRPSSNGSVSVVVPSYSHATYIEQCLRSIMGQTLQPMELIVIDDGSPDDSWQTIDRVLKDCPFPCEYYTRENRGLCNTLNEGLDKARGEYFAYLGSDDIWLPAFLDSRLATLSRSPDAPLVYGHSFVIDDVCNVIDRSYGWGLPRGSTRDMLLFSFVPTSPSILYRADALRHEKWDPAIKLEDFDLYLRLCRMGEFAFDPNILSCWRTHAANTSKQVELMVDECIAAVERNAEHLGLTEAEFVRYVRAMSIHLVDAFVDDGQRAEAIEVFLRNIRGFRNASELMKRAAKLLAPKMVIEKRRKLAKRFIKPTRLGTIDADFNFVEA